MQVMAIVFLGVILSKRGYIDNDKQKVGYISFDMYPVYSSHLIVVIKTKFGILYTLSIIFKYSICDIL